MKIRKTTKIPKINISNLSIEESNFIPFATFLRASPFYLTILTTRINLVSLMSFHIRPILAILTTPLIEESFLSKMPTSLRCSTAVSVVGCWLMNYVIYLNLRQE